MERRFADLALEALRAAGAAAAPGEERAVSSVVVRVGDGADGALVSLERTADGMRVACSCGRRPCVHLARAVDVFGRPAVSAATTVSLPPPAPTPVPAGPHRTRPSDAEMGGRLRALLDVLVDDGAAVGSERTDAALEELVRFLHGVDAYGLHRSLADLRRELATADPSPDRLLRATDVLEATCQVLERRAAGAAIDETVYDVLVGRDRPLDACEVRDELTLLEVARNSARTPFGYRRAERFLVDLATGARYAELVPVPLSPEFAGGPDRYGGSVGPFPRVIRADLAAIEPGPSPRRLRLLQYHVDVDVRPEHLRRLAAAAATDAAASYAEFAALSGALGVAYPCFVIFAPARVVFREGEATLVDAADRVLPLARTVAPDTCAAADRFMVRGRVEAVVGHLLLLRRTLALSPLSLLIDSPRGERLLRLR
jgi:hypothetical protein